MPRENRERVERIDEVHGFLDQSNISPKNLARLRILTGHEDNEVAEHAALVLEIVRVLPGKRNRWIKLAQRHKPLFEETIRLFGIEFFEDLLAGYGDFESPLWDVLERCRSQRPRSRSFGA